jgi:hypothetical protein
MMPTPAAEPEWDDLKREFGAACAQSAKSARRQIAHDLNQLFRRFRQYEREAGWVSLVMEGAGKYARQAALFAMQGDVLELRGALNLDLSANFQIAGNKAAAFEAVLQSKESVTALRTSGELGAELSSAGKLAHLFPILNGSRVAAILFTAVGDEAEVDALELVCGMAASALERQANSGLHAQIAVAGAPQPKPVPSTRSLPAWSDMPAEHAAAHSRAARFARVSVAEMQLAKPAACRTGREKGNLYVLLGKEIDKARETYRKQFMTMPSMVDYFHRELVAFVLAGDATKLGADYPGELA